MNFFFEIEQKQKMFNVINLMCLMFDVLNFEFFEKSKMKIHKLKLFMNFVFMNLFDKRQHRCFRIGKISGKILTILSININQPNDDDEIP